MGSQQSAAITIEKFLQRTVLGTLVLAINYTLGTAEYLVAEDLAATLGLIQKALGVVVIIIVAPAFYRAFKLGGFRKKDCDEPEGFVSELISKASTMAFSLTFVSLMLLEGLSNHFFTDQPPAFFLHVALTLSLYAFSISFFIMNRDTDDDDDFDAEEDA